MFNKMVKGLYAHMNIPIIRGNQSNPRPPKPYITYVPLVFQNDDEGNESQEGLDLQLRQSVSFTVFGANPNQAYDMARKAHRWFKYVGYDYLVREGIIVIEEGAIETRDILEVDKYDYRQGFDVVFRTAERIDSDGNFIEFYSIEQKEG